MKTLQFLIHCLFCPWFFFCCVGRWGWVGCVCVGRWGWVGCICAYVVRMTWREGSLLSLYHVDPRDQIQATGLGSTWFTGWAISQTLIYCRKLTLNPRGNSWAKKCHHGEMEGEELQARFSYTANLRAAWVTWDSLKEQTTLVMTKFPHGWVGMLWGFLSLKALFEEQDMRNDPIYSALVWLLKASYHISVRIWFSSCHPCSAWE